MLESLATFLSRSFKKRGTKASGSSSYRSWGYRSRPIGLPSPSSIDREGSSLGEKETEVLDALRESVKGSEEPIERLIGPGFGDNRQTNLSLSNGSVVPRETASIARITTTNGISAARHSDSNESIPPEFPV